MPRRPSHDWPAVLESALDVLADEGLMPRPDLWRLLLRLGLANPDGEHGFRTAVSLAQQRGTFPSLPRSITGPVRRSEWSEDRFAAEQVRQGEPTPYELFTTREAECIAMLRDLTGVVTVRLSPSSFAIFQAKGYSELLVRRAVFKLVRNGLAEARYERSGLDDVPCVRAA